MRTVARQKGYHKSQAYGLTAALKQQLIAACPDDLRGLRDRVIISVGYDTLCRRSELVRLEFRDLSVSEDGSGSIKVHQTKSIRSGNVRLAYVSAQSVAHIRRWARAAHLRTGAIFRRICDERIARGPLSPYAVGRIIKLRAKDADLDEKIIARLSSHSFRVGAAQDMAASGIDLSAIMLAGGWKSPNTVLRYVEQTDVRHGGMAKLYARMRTVAESGSPEFISPGMLPHSVIWERSTAKGILRRKHAPRKSQKPQMD